VPARVVPPDGNGIRKCGPAELVRQQSNGGSRVLDRTEQQTPADGITGDDAVLVQPMGSRRRRQTRAHATERGFRSKPFADVPSRVAGPPGGSLRARH
jgi:hypothetical protein